MAATAAAAFACTPTMHTVGPCRNVACVPGSVQWPLKHTNAIRLQRYVQRNVPMSAQRGWLGTHNSFISQAYGMGVCDRKLTQLFGAPFNSANQMISVTDQLNGGARHIEADVHWVGGALRLCHAGGIKSWWVNAAVRTLAFLFGENVDWDSETIGCIGNEQTFVTGMKEILVWLRHNGDGPVFLYLDDQEDLQAWEKAQYLAAELRVVFGTALVTPDRIPMNRLLTKTPQELGNVIIPVSRTAYVHANSTLYPRTGFNGWQEFPPAQLRQSNCTTSQRDVGTIYSRELTSYERYGNWYNAEPSRGRWTAATVCNAFCCNVAFLCLEDMSINLLHEVAGLTWLTPDNLPQPDETELVFVRGSTPTWMSVAATHGMMRVQARLSSPADVVKLIQRLQGHTVVVET